MPSEPVHSDENPRAAHRTFANVGRTMIGEDLALTLKIVVAGGFGAGKSTLIGSVSEIRPLHSEETLSESEAGSGPDRSDTGGVERKNSTTVAMDFGRITVHAGLSLHLFGTPGQDRFRFLWEELCEGALAAVVLADTRRLEDCFPALDYFESCGLPYIVAVNHFEGTPGYEAEDVREALTVPPQVPIVIMDARNRITVVESLLALVGHALDVTPA